MKRSQRLIEMQHYIIIKKEFTAQEIANEFNVSVRTVHRDMLELTDLGVYLYTEQGRNGGYRLISNSVLPPINFTEDEAIAIFFACQSLSFYNSLPFEIDIKTVLRKLHSKLPLETKMIVDKMKGTFVLKSTYRNVTNIFLKDLLKYCGTKKIIEIKYNSKSGEKIYKIVPICLYNNNGFWYIPSLDLAVNKIKHFRVDRVLTIKDTEKKSNNINKFMDDCFGFHKISRPVRLYAELNSEGIRASQDNPYIANDIYIDNILQKGYIDEIIDVKDVEFLGDFFIQLGENVKVFEPVVMKEYMIDKALKILKIYER